MNPIGEVDQRTLIGTRPVTPEGLWNWVRAFTGVRIARAKVCPGHDTPWTFFERMYFDRPSLALVLGSRGAGKSFLSALDTHLMSRWHARHGTRILGGSKSQSEQVYRALKEAVWDGMGPMGSDREAIETLLRTTARYRNGSEVALLAASNTSVRGPHVPSLKLDEVDEIPVALREAAMGMCMDRNGSKASVLMTSTWHRVGGPMSELLELGQGGAFPVYSFCAFDVLERCSVERSGPRLENCPQCPLVVYCHGANDGGPPLAKRSDGHYAIDALIQKMRSTSARTFEADYLCRGPKADGLWFPAFRIETHVDARAEYDPALPVHVAIDSGVFTGVVFFQVARVAITEGAVDEVRVFADHLAEGHTAEANARTILEIARTRCNGRLDVTSTDPAGGARNPVGPTVISEYERAGIRNLRRWPMASVADGLALVESFVSPADGIPRLIVHPRCVATARAMQNYRRARRGGQWQDYPEDPQHPHEDLVDALRGGLRDRFPEGRAVRPTLARVPARQVF
ncbi:MAG: hypothetical protein JWN86_2020 [Planctomycetota bacterium]|nr:hypothetical protein [Planctomycetota bacterium]